MHQIYFHSCIDESSQVDYHVGNGGTPVIISNPGIEKVAKYIEPLGPEGASGYKLLEHGNGRGPLSGKMQVRNEQGFGQGAKPVSL